MSEKDVPKDRKYVYLCNRTINEILAKSSTCFGNVAPEQWDYRSLALELIHTEWRRRQSLVVEPKSLRRRRTRKRKIQS